MLDKLNTPEGRYQTLSYFNSLNQIYRRFQICYNNVLKLRLSVKSEIHPFWSKLIHFDAIPQATTHRKMASLLLYISKLSDGFDCQYYKVVFQFLYILKLIIWNVFRFWETVADRVCIDFSQCGECAQQPYFKYI